MGEGGCVNGLFDLLHYRKKNCLTAFKKEMVLVADRSILTGDFALSGTNEKVQ
jgi:hypothetical protein